jgi:UTP--glucose-1-phosphate uridylyltransferase
MQTKPVRKAVIAAAGFGTRFLPQTKAMPKEMLPLVDKPIIQYIVEDLVAAGIEDIVIVTGYHKRSIEDHFDNMSTDLRANLKQGGKLDLLEETKKISNLADFAYVRQKGPYGNATPLMNVRHLIGDEPFIYTYADDLIVAEPIRFKQMITLYNEYGCSILPCIRIDKEEDYNRYGVVAGEPIKDGVLKMSTIIEKPGKERAPSNYASIGGYLLTPDIFPYLEAASTDIPEGQEFQVQPAMRKMIEDGKQLLALEIQNARYYDTGDKLEYLKTVVDFALDHDDIKEEFKDYLKSLNV